MSHVVLELLELGEHHHQAPIVGSEAPDEHE
jgi:hypothetical protein